MKAAILSLALASASFVATDLFAEGACAEGGNQHGAGSIDPYAPISDVPYYPESVAAPEVFQAVLPNGGSASAVSPTAPSARITVVNPALQSSSSGRLSTSATPTARLTVVTAASAGKSKDKDTEVAKALETIQSDTTKVSAETPAATVATETIDPALKGLVGTWMAVARQGDGELTTVELQLDDRGWAKLTVPGADGKPSTMKRRVELEDEELKLSGPDAELSLGKLIESNSRQMVLARADGQITFVRP